MAKILVVDDMPMTHLLLRIMLSRINHTVVDAFNGKEALKQLGETEVDLIITDINMPQMDGLTLIENLKADEKLNKLPIIIMTASIQEHLNLVAKGWGDNPILTQPITSRELNDAVARCLSQHVCAD